MVKCIDIPLLAMYGSTLDFNIHIVNDRVSEKKMVVSYKFLSKKDNGIILCDLQSEENESFRIPGSERVSKVIEEILAVILLVIVWQEMSSKPGHLRPQIGLLRHIRDSIRQSW